MSKTINGIFEPFHKYVSKQLDIRKIILTPQGAILPNISNNAGGEEDSNDAVLSEEEQIEKLKREIKEDNTSIKNHNHHNLFHTYTIQKQCTIRMASGVDLRSKNNILTEYEKLRLGITKGEKNSLLDDSFSEYKKSQTFKDSGMEGFYDGSNFAKFWTLQGGIHMDWSDQLHVPEYKLMNDEVRSLRGGIHGDPILSKYIHADDRAYGSPLLRGDAVEGYGIVPMPGIINAEISTKSEDGSLREAKVNFVAHNKRQLEVLEMLYMRPGYPIMLEWGWFPYINNGPEIIQNTDQLDTYAIDTFFDSDTSLSEINLMIRQQKAESGGNYDGFVGFCKNFLFKAREDGGYDCTTEIIAHGEILESLKSPIRTTPELVNYANFDYQVAKKITYKEDDDDTIAKTEIDYNSQATKFLSAESYESIDSFLFYLKSIKSNLDQAGIKAALTFDGTDYAHYGRNILYTDSDHNRAIKKYIPASHTNMLDEAPYEAFFTPTIGNIEYKKNDFGIYKIQTKHEMSSWESAGTYEKKAIEEEVGGVLSNKVLEADYFLRNVYKVEGTDFGGYDYDRQQVEDRDLPVFVYYKIPGADGKEKIIPINHLNVVHNQYFKGMSEIEQLVKDISKVSDKQIEQEKIDWQIIPGFMSEQLVAAGSPYDSKNPYWIGAGVHSDVGHKGNSNYSPFTYEDVYPDGTYDYDNKYASEASNVVSYVDRAWIGRQYEYVPVFDAQLNFGDRDIQHTLEKDGFKAVSNTITNDVKKKREELNNHLGVQSLYNGTILKEFSLVDETSTDSGIRKKIFVRWDLICQILNQLTTPKYRKDHALVELTYLTKDSPTYRSGTNNNEKYDKDKKGNIVEGTYLPYSRDVTNHHLPLWGVEQFGFSKKEFPDEVEEILENMKLLKKETKFANAHGAKMKIGDPSSGGKDHYVTYPPLLGRSFDNDVCLMPHQIKGMHFPWYVRATSDKEAYWTQEEADKLPTSEGWKGIRYGQRKYHKPTSDQRTYTTNFTSFENIKADEANNIGHVYFNLDYLISTYEGLATEEYKTTNSVGEERSKKRLKKKFSMHDFITDIWNGVNDACGGFYDFGLHTEHERPHVVRVVDFTMNGGSKDLDNTQKIFEFDPQSIKTIARDANYQSKLDNDFASTVSIAAQAPNDISSLESVSFKAFHKGIKNRFTDNTSDKDIRDQQIEEARTRYIEDYKEYIRTVKSLLVYIKRQNESNYETDFIPADSDTGEDAYVLRPITPDTAKSMARQLHDKRISLLSRYPSHDENLEPYDGTHPSGKHMGEYIDDLTIAGSPTFERNAIIPLTVSLELDGISGISPLNIFKINSDKLPKGYQDPNIVFVVKKLREKITKNQDWSTSLTGYLSFLNDNPTTGVNLDFTNASTYTQPNIELTNKLNTLSQQDEKDFNEGGHGANGWRNPFDVKLNFTSGNLWPKRKKGAWHAGVDIYLPYELTEPHDKGVPIVAPRTGYVIQCGRTGGYGNYTVIEFEKEDPTIRHNMWDIGAPDVGNYQVSEDGMSLVGSSDDERYTFPKNNLHWTTGKEGELTGYQSSGKPVKRALFAHMQRLDYEWVGKSRSGYPWKNEEEKERYKVVAGTVIGISGGKVGEKGSGNATGPHLHYEIGTEDAFTKAWWDIAWGNGRGPKKNPFSNSSDKDKQGTTDGIMGKRLRVFYAMIDPRYVLTKEGGKHPDVPEFPPFDSQGGWNSNPNSLGFKNRDPKFGRKLVMVMDVGGSKVTFKYARLNLQLTTTQNKQIIEKVDLNERQGVYYDKDGLALKDRSMIVELYDNGDKEMYVIKVLWDNQNINMGEDNYKVITHIKIKPGSSYDSDVRLGGHTYTPPSPYESPMPGGGSDIRIKTNLKKVGDTKYGIPLYEFNYKNMLNLDHVSRYRGIIAQDLLKTNMSKAVYVMDNGYYAVDYSQLDINLIKIS